jgi:hypothetical protein
MTQLSDEVVERRSMTTQEIIARIVSPEAWLCVENWDEVPQGVRRACDVSLNKAKAIAKLVGPTSTDKLLNIRRYIDGLIDTYAIPPNAIVALRSWQDEIDSVLAEAKGDIVLDEG